MGNVVLENKVRQYFDAWLENRPEALEQLFAPEIVYSECYGPEYQGLEQVKRWFADWNRKGKVLEWRIKSVLQEGQNLAVEWYFCCEYQGKRDAFDGVSLLAFNEGGKIVSLKEFQSVAEHVFPYGKNGRNQENES